MSLGYREPLYLLPFDHRHSYVAGIVRLLASSDARAARPGDGQQAGHLRRIRTGAGRRRADVPRRSPRRRGVRRRHPSRREQRAGTSPRSRPRRAARTSSSSNTARRLPSTLPPSTRPSSKVLVRYNPEGNECPQSASDGPAQTALRLLSGHGTAFHVRAAGAGDEGADGCGPRRAGDLRPADSAGADAPRHRRAAGRRRRARRLEDRRAGPPGGLRAQSSTRRGVAVGPTSAASCWGAEPTRTGWCTG